jgi:cyclophilin family peptidyl-prolyl cis-trans isomerase
VFGRVTKGMTVADAISALTTDGRDKPVEDAVIERVELSES